MSKILGVEGGCFDNVQTFVNYIQKTVPKCLRQCAKLHVFGGGDYYCFSCSGGKQKLFCGQTLCCSTNTLNTVITCWSIEHSVGLKKVKIFIVSTGIRSLPN